ncbi:hypothetical protein QYM36_010483 [Artemia franciscana]|uniref:Uncharacterized protein n=2 Tax=Artemia franciscana TaxID=6661 RepID=A0AA88HXD4_ARTSF|nr:hypothetical protein QYM36_010483 [Artemia franciscana]
MALYWMTEAIPLAITSLLPVIFFPLFGIMSTGAVCIAYMKETNVVFIGGMMVAIAIEHCNLHKRLALSVLLVVGTSPRWLMLGFMGTTMFLSMWICNTAATAMMLPIVEAVVDELYSDDKVENELYSSQSKIDSISGSIASSQEAIIERKRPTKNLSKDKVLRACLLSIAYSANVGGTGTIIGSSPQLAFKGILATLYPNQDTLNFATWMAFNVPVMLVNLVILWLWVQILYIGFKCDNVDRKAQAKAQKAIRKSYDDLGSMSFHESMVLVLFLLLVILWCFRDPQFMPGWAEPWRNSGIRIGDGTAAIIVVALLFVVPAEPYFLFCRRESSDKHTGAALLTWKACQERIPWGIVLLLGGGFALSDATKVSGLSEFLGSQLEGLKVLPDFAILFLVCIMVATVTEIASNTATANILLPVLARVCELIKVNPLYLMMPATVTCSYAFMLPVATPPNAIVFSAGKMKVTEMIRAGFLMNICCVVVLCLLTETLGVAIFDIKTFPEWATNLEQAIIFRNESELNG